jgi:phage shock protein PspC (stress-responsive transcriptional regulator)/nitrate reductase NapAB chaperone NapD
MKKTFTINISGIIFHIDEDAFEKLSNYLNTIKGCFTNSEGKDEIIADIEARIAEMLQAKISDNKQVITIEDISEIIAVMGEPEQIGADNGAETKSSTTSTETRKRLYREPDNKILGGVCGGIGAYFNIDPVWIRVAFVASLFIFGSGTLLYIILWVIIPQAVTTKERLEMRGEPINISNIEKSIHEEIDGLKSRLNNLKDEAKSTYSRNFRNQHPRTAVEKILDVFLMIGKYFIRTIAIIIGVVFIMVGIFLVIGLISSFVKTNDIIWISPMGISNFSFPVFLKLFIVSSGQITLALIGLGLFIGIPLIMLVYNGIKMIFGYKSKRRFIGISSFTLWFGGLILCLIVSLSILSSFSHKLVVPKKTELIQPQNNLLKIYMNKKSLVDSISDEETKFHIGQWNFVSLNGKNFRFGLPELRVISSENENYQLLVYYSSKGATNEEAKEHINKIEYKFAQNDTALILDPYYLLAENEKWRNQNIKIIIKVPHWKVIYLSPETTSILHYDNDNFDYSKDLAGKKWIMTENGLKEYYAPQVVGASDTTKKVIADPQKKASSKN